jgi:hypothetical protein
VADQCLLKFESCWFGKSRAGVVLHNELGGFTEYVQFHGCSFNSEARQAIVYKRTGGTDSFHGSGLVGCTINEAAGEVLPKIAIGGALSTNQNIIIYNAPLSIQTWKQSGTPFIRNDSTRFGNNFHGVLTFETFGPNAFDIADTAGAQGVWLNGSFHDFNMKVRQGALSIVDGFKLRADGAIFGRHKPKPVIAKVLPAGGGAILSMYAISGETYKVIVRFTSSASPWQRAYELTCFNEPNIPKVTVIANLQEYYSGDLSPPVFSLSGGVLSAVGSGWPANTVHVWATATQIGDSLDTVA